MLKNNMAPQWRLRALDQERCKVLAAESKLPFQLVALLMHRNITSPEEINAFLYPELDKLPDPFLMKDMETAVKIVATAWQGRQPVLIYGDYDVDGLTGSAVLSLFLKQLGLTVLCLQPNRLSDGYGVHTHLLEQGKNMLGEAGKPLLITVDCGISNHDEIQAAKELGFTVIVTDHHQPSDTLPPAAAILNPLQPGCEFPFKQLAGAGVAFYLAMGIRSHIYKTGLLKGTPPNLRQYLDLVALGSVADMVELRGVNRILVRAGLAVLNEGNRTGIAALCRSAGVKETVHAADIGYRLAPRLNAASRQGSADAAFELLVTSEKQRAQELAGELEQANESRKELVEKIYQEAQTQAAAYLGQDGRCLVLAGEEWHPGVLGIVAARLAREFNRPSLVFSVTNTIAKGSGRSIEGVNLLAAVAKESDFLMAYGGHAMAIGVTMHAGMLEKLRNSLNEAMASLNEDDLQPVHWIDWQAETEEDGRDLSDLEKWYPLLEPFGMGNPEPILASRNVPQNGRIVGTGHLKFRWPMTGKLFDAILFNHGSELPVKEQRFIFSLRRNSYQGKESWQLHGHALQQATS